MKTTSYPIFVGISSCLLGEPVRFDGGHKKDELITEKLAPFFSWVPVCPEMEMGLGTPRESMQLVKAASGTKLVTNKTQRDLSRPMKEFANARVAKLSRQRLSGYLLKKNSPSCGMEKVKVYDHNGSPSSHAPGHFAKVLVKQLPNLPVEEEGRLRDPALLENWISRVFAYDALQRLWDSRWSLGQLVAFHTRFKMTLLAHSPTAYQKLGRLVASGKRRTRESLREEYEAQFMEALKKVASVKRQVNVLQHMVGWFKKELDAEAKKELLDLIEDYRVGMVSLAVPLTLISHYVRALKIDYLQDQAYLNPHPKELALRKKL